MSYRNRTRIEYFGDTRVTITPKTYGLKRINERTRIAIMLDNRGLRPVTCCEGGAGGIRTHVEFYLCCFTDSAL